MPVERSDEMKDSTKDASRGADRPPSYEETQKAKKVVTFTTQPQLVDSPVVRPRTLVVPGGVMLSAESVMVLCPQCGTNVETMVENRDAFQRVVPQFENGGLTLMLAGGLALLGCWMGCCLLPMCFDECKDAIHRCPNCHRFIGLYKRV